MLNYFSIESVIPQTQPSLSVQSDEANIRKEDGPGIGDFDEEFCFDLDDENGVGAEEDFPRIPGLGSTTTI